MLLLLSVVLVTSDGSQLKKLQNKLRAVESSLFYVGDVFFKFVCIWAAELCFFSLDSTLIMTTTLYVCLTQVLYVPTIRRKSIFDTELFLHKQIDCIF